MDNERDLESTLIAIKEVSIKHFFVIPKPLATNIGSLCFLNFLANCISFEAHFKEPLMVYYILDLTNNFFYNLLSKFNCQNRRLT